MKVLVFTSLYPNNVWPHHGVFVKERMSQVARVDGCSVKIIAPVPYFPPIQVNSRWYFSQVKRQEMIEDLDVYHPQYFMIPKIGMIFYGLTLLLSVLPLVRRIQKEFAFDLIDAHFVYPDGFAAVLLGVVCRKPVVVSARGSDINRYMRFPLIRHLLRYTLLKANRVIAVSRALKDAMVQLGVPEEKISVIPNGVDAGKFYPFPKPEARRKLGLPNKKILLSVGGLTPGKGFDVLLKSLKILAEEFHETDLYLVIVGEGAFRTELEEMVASLNLKAHVRLAGDIPHQDLYLWYNAADLFCLASSMEGWPNVLLESLACGTPVVATAVGGIPEIIRSEMVGLLTQRSDREIAQSIFWALKKPWDTEAIVRYAREQTWERTASAVLHAFASVLPRKENPRTVI